ncbi:MAG: fibronectin type III domain-containing protein [bacterium]
MLYTKFYLKKEFKIPTILSLFLIIATLYTTGRLLLTTPIPSRAQKGVVEKTEIVNIYPNQATIAWISQENESGWVLYGTTPDSLKNTASDIRDLTSKRGGFKNHLVILKNLNNNTKYYVLITSGDKLIYNNKKPFEFTTPNSIEFQSDQKPAYGSVYNKNNKPLENVMVIISVKESLKHAALSTKTGEWLIPLNYILDTNLKQFNTTENDNVKIEMYSNDGKKTIINTQISNISPLSQKIILGQNNNDTLKEKVLGKSIQNIKLDIVDFIYPENKAIISASIPLIKGVALPNSYVNINLIGKNINKKYNVKADKNGKWNLSSINSLASGEYTLNLSSNDALGKKIEKQRTFTITKSGEQVLGEATPSAIIDTPTPTPYIEPTQIPTQAIVTQVPTLPVSGGSEMTLWFGSIGLVITGFLLILLSSI